MTNTNNSLMLTGVIGCGNAGSQIADLAQNEGFDCFIINSSIRDMATVNFPQERMAIIGEGRGVGKDRAKSKEYMKMCIKEQVINAKVFKDFMHLKEVVFIVSSTGGGTGSGLAPTLLNLLQHIYPTTKFILVGILPTNEESYDTLENTIAYMQELTKLNCTFMSYDNSKSSKVTINNEIVEDFKVIRGDYINTALNDAIDENDMAEILNNKGRIVVGRVTDIENNSPINELLLDSITNNNYATNIDGVSGNVKFGVMSTLTAQLSTKFDDNILAIRKTIGEGILFKNIAKGNENKIAVVATGLALPSNRMAAIVDKVNAIKLQIEENIDKTTDNTWMSYKIDTPKEVKTPKVNEDFDLDAFIAAL